MAFATGACGGNSASPTPQGQVTPTTSGAIDYTKLRGSIQVDGSSTVFPITEGVAEDFGRLTKGNVRITVGVSGSGGGFKKFCNGETDITDASRPISPAEVDHCEARGIEYIELPVALDGLTVVVNPRNDFVQCMTVAELRTLWGPEAEGKVDRWSHVRSNWPGQGLRLYGPGADSGSFDYFTEVINGKARASRGDFTASEDDNVLVRGVAGDENGLGYFGYAYFVENQNRLKAIAIDGGRGCVTVSSETINNGAYSPLSRPLFLYVSHEAAGKAAIKEFLRYYLGKDGRKVVSEVGFIPFPDRVYDLVVSRLERGPAGTLFGGSSPKRGSVESVLSTNP